MPIIFAQSIMFIPNTILTFFPDNEFLQGLAAYFQYTSITYSIIYALMIIFFTYFYTAITFEPHQIAKNLQKNGAFIPGVRPGQTTAEYLGNIITRITLVGALFLGTLAVLPLILKGVTGITAITIGGTALLIVVSVVLDLVKKIDAQTSIREY